ncbi:MAG: hypothetical protein ACRDTM_08905 [Micromonosporaceae bacterium]
MGVYRSQQRPDDERREHDWRDWLIVTGIAAAGVALIGVTLWYVLGALP